MFCTAVILAALAQEDPAALARQAWLPKAPPLPKSEGPVVRVASVNALFKAVETAEPKTTILLADGTYGMPRILDLRTDGLTLRGESGDRSKVVLDAARSRHGEIVWITGCRDVTIADLTIQNTKWNGFKINSDSGVQGLRIYNCIIRNIWQRGVKGVAVPERDRERLRPRRCRIEYCLFVNDRPKRLEDDPHDNDAGNYIAGIDVMYADGWIVRRNVFVGIRGRTGEGRGAVFFWVDTRRLRVEENVIIACDRGVSLGNPTRDAKTPFHATGCRVENNFITAAREGGVFLASTKDCTVRFNSVHEPSGRWGRLIWAWDRNGGLTVENNLLTGSKQPMNVPDGAAFGNVTVEHPGFFVDPDRGNLHLKGRPREVLGRAAGEAHPDRDIDGDPRPGTPDVGADEAAP